jgi:NAD(P)-dependent dehydrogenase (short-subunit alcohol dehydrogenase family)
MRTTFITGCDSGFGHNLAKYLLARGERVVATDPNVTGLADRISPKATDRLLVLPLDVRDESAVQQAVSAALAWSPIDVLVNNAGIALFCAQEEADLDLVSQMFDVNVLGPARVSRALLPTLRQRAGTIVQLSSVAGRTVFPESGFYAATKYALEAMSEALFQEACTFGVRMRLIEPGSFATRFLERASQLSPPRDPASPYATVRQTWDAKKQEALASPQDPSLVVEAIVASLDRSTPFERVVVGADATQILAERERLGPDGWSLSAAAKVGLDR